MSNEGKSPGQNNLWLWGLSLLVAVVIWLFVTR